MCLLIAEFASIKLGSKNILEDFMLLNGNYHLAGNSPSAGTGFEGVDMGALGVGCDDIWLPPTIATMADTSMDEDGELSLQLSAESSQDYDIYFEAQSDTSSVYAYIEGDMLHIDLMSDWNGSSGIRVIRIRAVFKSACPLA